MLCLAPVILGLGPKVWVLTLGHFRAQQFGFSNVVMIVFIPGLRLLLP